MAPLEVKNVKISTIQPFEKTNHPGTLYCTLLDLSGVDFYIPFVAFYRPNQEGSVPGSLISNLKESLSKVLVPYYPYAGHWVRTYDNKVRELQCNDEGVPFIEAYVNQEMNSVLNNGDFKPESQLSSLELLGLDSKTAYQECDIPMPALLIQATQFRCGGVALSVTFNHLTGDGHAMVTFMSAWSQIAMHGETSIVPNHDRSLIFSREAFMELVAAAFGHPSQGDDSDWISAETNGTIPTSETKGTDQNNGSVQKSELLRTDPAVAHKFPVVAAVTSKILHVKREAIEKLKSEAAKEKIDVTTLDLITAHMWRGLYSLPVTKKKSLGASISTYVEGRKRFHAPLSEHYLGNVVIVASTPPVPSAQMASYSHPFAASIVHNAVQGVNPSTWKDYMLDLVKSLHSFSQLDYTQLHMTSWHRFPIYNLSFVSSFGTPIYAVWNACNQYLPLGVVVVLPPPPQHSEDIVATVQVFLDDSNGTGEALYSDPEFLSFFQSTLAF